MDNVNIYIPELEDFHEDNEEAEGQKVAYLTVIKVALAIYNEQISKGVPKVVAQLVLPRGIACVTEEHDFDLVVKNAEEFLKNTFT